MNALFLLLACNPAAPPTPATPTTTAPAPAPAPEPAPVEPAPVEPAPTAGTKAIGESCTEATDCASGFCEGEGCGPDHPGACVGTMRPCTRDLAVYCGCDGATFKGSGSCPNRRYDHRGPCVPATP